MEEDSMGKFSKFLFFLFVLFLIPFNEVKAECSLSEISRLTKIANNVNISYVFDENANATFDITVNNLTSEIYMLETTTNKRYNYNPKEEEITINDIAAGTVLKFEFYATKKDCNGDKIVSRTINLPSYNPYYKDILCKKAQEHRLCQRFYKTSISRTEFEKTIKNYLEQKESKDEITTNDNIWLTLFIEYYWVLYGIIIIIGSTIIIINYRKNKLF